MIGRIEEARKGYLAKDFVKTRNSHRSLAIRKSINHQEGHLTNFTLPEIILGGQDGLVNVLGVILGVAAATQSTEIVIVAGLSATFAESISMAAVAYTSKLAQADYYQSEKEREAWEIEKVPQGEKEEVRELYKSYGFEGKLLDEVVKKITSNKEIWLKVMMEQELKLTPVERKEAIPAAAIVGGAALVGSFIPLLPFIMFPLNTAIIYSLIISSCVLLAVGYYKAEKTLGRSFLRSALEMMIIGMLSAFVGYFIGSLFKVQTAF